MGCSASGKKRLKITDKKIKTSGLEGSVTGNRATLFISLLQVSTATFVPQRLD
jgi:hypothetical protein